MKTFHVRSKGRKNWIAIKAPNELTAVRLFGQMPRSQRIKNRVKK